MQSKNCYAVQDHSSTLPMSVTIESSYATCY